jgi:branched-subunit amino acid ABC-type transport system permease component
MTLTIPALVAALALGYTLGRLRPWLRLGDWAEEQVRLHPAQWIGSRWREAVLFTALVATQPFAAFGVLRQVRRERRASTP